MTNQRPPPARRERPPSAGRANPALSVKTVAVLAFIVGVALHGCVALSILGDDDKAEDEPGTELTSPGSGLPASPTPLPDRTSCDEIRGTQYRSDAERDFFQANCVTGTLGLPGLGPRTTIVALPIAPAAMAGLGFSPHSDRARLPARPAG